MAFAITEPDAGSDLAAQTTRAEKTGDDYVITGTKHLISNAGVATHYTLFARTGEGRKGVSAFLVPATTPGLGVEKQRPTSPHPLGRVTLEKVRVPAANRLGGEGDGLKLALMTLERCRPTVAAAANGFARLWIQVPDVRREQARLEDLSVSIAHPAERKPWGLSELVVRDPDGLDVL